MTHLSERILFGAAYYHEYQPSRRLEEDMDLMQQAHFTVIRVGESVWSTWEPENGVFDLDWLEPVLNAAHARGICVIVGTPTYAAPPWLARAYPEINAQRATGQPAGWGARQEIDFTHPAFLFHAERIIRKIMDRYAGHPAVIGFQVDNEPGNEIFFNHGVFQKFVDHLRHTYGTVDKLNTEWGLTYWSHRLSSWSDLWTPDGNAQPQYALAWRRFQAQLTTDFIHWQAEIVREYAREDQFVTTCISYERKTAQDDALTKKLDITAGNPYYRMQDYLALPAIEPLKQEWTTEGTWSLYATADRMFSSKQAPFLVTETNAQAIGHSHQNEPAYDGQWRQAAWALVSRGATMIEYWHWHTLHFGAETYWGGVLPHSLEPGRVYRQIAQLGQDFETAGPLVAGLIPDADVALVYSNDTKWALEEAPQLAHNDVPDTRSFQTIFDSFYRGAFDAGLQSRIVHQSQLAGMDPAAFAAAQPVLIAAGLAITTDDELRWYDDYAAAGGHLIMGIRTGYQDHEARARKERKPALLDVASGVYYDEFSTLREPIPVTAILGSAFAPSPGAMATNWIDGLQSTGAEHLLGYEHPQFSRWPALTSRPHGAGAVTYVGTVPNPVLAADIARWATRRQTNGGWKPAIASQTVTGARSRDGRRLRFLHNWSWTPSDFVLPAAVTDLLGDQKYEAGDILPLGAWDVRVLIEG
ncbi:beta-galactosidase [Arthrobacter sp. ov118]|uniref:beta-galactosidase n=1 Tax=Arthrobacter sp. ov118 TaxID=1761747 RepID=UPI0008E290B9|nr:beta-galactosidase [Arthrobacter sp. ov118]SFT75556.1 beta-galactosidase [Arthrobacter sp. ov118]